MQLLNIVTDSHINAPWRTEDKETCLCCPYTLNFFPLGLNREVLPQASLDTVWHFVLWSGWPRSSAPPEYRGKKPQLMGCESPIYKGYQAASACGRKVQNLAWYRLVAPYIAQEWISVRAALPALLLAVVCKTLQILFIQSLYIQLSSLCYFKMTFMAFVFYLDLFSLPKCYSSIFRH